MTDGTLVLGVVMVAAGLMLLLNTLFPWFDRLMWPLVLVAAGFGLMYSGRRRGS